MIDEEIIYDSITVASRPKRHRSDRYTRTPGSALSKGADKIGRAANTSTRAKATRTGSKRPRTWSFARAMRVKAKAYSMDTPSNYAEAVDSTNPYSVEWG
jgi:hypothetical protein